MFFECVSSKTFLFEPGKKYRLKEYTNGSIVIEGEFESEYNFDEEMKAAYQPSGRVIATFK